MILLQDMMDTLAVTVFNNTIYAEDTAIRADKEKAVMIAINSAISAICMEYPISRGRFGINLEDHLTNYYLTTDYAWSNTASTQPIKYLQDSPDYPYRGDIQQIIIIYNELGEEVPFMNPGDPLSLYVLESNEVLYHPYPRLGNTLEIIYWGIFEKIPFRDVGFDMSTYILKIPNTFMMALVYYVGSIMLDTKMTAADQIQSVSFKLLYDEQIQKLLQSGLIPSDIPVENRFDARGYI